MQSQGPISAILKRKLKATNPDDIVSVLIGLKPSDGLDKALEGLPSGNTPERREIITAYNQGSIDSISTHLDNKEVTYSIAPLLRVINAQMNLDQIYEIAEKEYVSYITYNSDVTL